MTRPPDPLGLTRDEHAAVERLLRVYPDATARLRAAVLSLVNRLLERAEGAALTEAQADELLVGLVDRIAAGTTPGMPAGTDDELLPGVVVHLLTRHFVAQARPAAVRRLVAARRN